ncbi:MAG: glycosyltransferase family 39 protein, partial [Dokdonella sp.]|nr:glycosyltransferase family 39 protein [Dokdonella sp.]
MPVTPLCAPAPAWQRDDALPLLAAFALLLPMVLLMPALPIDETRYLAVAWEMRQSGDFLVPHLNGATYAHKPPLLFWLINAGWLVTGVQAWTARAMTLACSSASLALMHRLAWRLSGSVAVARLATWLLAGTLYFGLFANAIMFDVPLATCVLLALLGVCDLVAGRMRRGVLVTGAAIGLGILVKGPVMLLDIACVALLAPWWSLGRLDGRRAAYFGALGVALLLGAAIALAWAIPAALHGGEDYARAIFLKQTLDRIQGVKGTSAHGRPWWWYLAVFPLMVLPWPLVVRGGIGALRARLRELQLDVLDWRWPAALCGRASAAWRCGIAWLVPTFVVFSLVSGKQPHYLLPLIPALALLLALGLDASILQLRGGLLGAVLVLLGVGLVVLHQLPLARASAEWVDLVSPWWSVPVIVLGAWLLRWRGPVPVAVPALAILALTLVAKLVVLWGPGVRYDITPIAQRIAALQAQGHAVASMGWHHGVYEFAARLPEPIPAFYTLDDFKAWVGQHPDGYVVTFFRQFRFRATPVFTQPFRGVEV